MIEYFCIISIMDESVRGQNNGCIKYFYHNLQKTLTKMLFNNYSSVKCENNLVRHTLKEKGKI